jgi:hypothetical protein
MPTSPTANASAIGETGTALAPLFKTTIESPETPEGKGNAVSVLRITVVFTAGAAGSITGAIGDSQLQQAKAVGREHPVCVSINI